MYSSAAEVISYTGVRPADFGLETDEALTSVIEGWLAQAKDLINADRNRDYSQEATVPPGINNIALRLVANMVAQAQFRRETPIVRVDDFNVQMVEDRVFTDGIRRDLARYPFKSQMRMVRMRQASELEDDEE